MYVITDSTRFAESSLGCSGNWQKLSESQQKFVHTGLVRELFQTAGLYIAEIKFDPLWRYAFITEFSCTSQFEILKRHFQKHTGVSYGIMCLAEGGKNFKGQRNRDWVTVPGNVHLSTYLNPAQKVEHFNLGFAILPVISILQAIDAFDGLHNKAAIKWVNDVLIDEAKIAGALTQTQVSGDTVTSFISGIGVNIETKPPAVPDLVVANADCVNSFVSPYQKISQHAFLKEFLTKFSANYQHLLSGGYDDLLNVYRQRSALVGRKVTVLSDPLNDRSEKVTEGIVQSIGENLELFLENHNHPVIRGRVVLN